MPDRGGHIARLPDEWAARLPVALLSLAFLLLFFYIIAREFNTKTAIAAVTILGTSAGWLAYSFGALTDLPMSALLGAAMLLTLFENKRWSGFAAGALLGLAVLAKAFVPLVLFAPVFLIARGKRAAIAVGLIAVALPWHVLVFGAQRTRVLGGIFLAAAIFTVLHYRETTSSALVVLLSRAPWPVCSHGLP